MVAAVSQPYSPEETDASRGYFAGVLVGSPSLRLTESEKRSIFRVHLEHALEDMRLDDEDKVRGQRIVGLPDISPSSGRASSKRYACHSLDGGIYKLG